jgi:hypothetical protein
MVYGVLADAVVLLHFGFLAYVIFGGFLAWRWRRAIVPHVVAAFWGFVAVAASVTCPLTYVENHFRRLDNRPPLRGTGFIDHYIEGVLYPERYTALLQAAAAVVVVASWLGAFVRWRATGRAPVAR